MEIYLPTNGTNIFLGTKKYQHGCRDGYEHISRWLKIYVNIVVPESPPLFPCSGVGRHVGVLAFL